MGVVDGLDFPGVPTSLSGKYPFQKMLLLGVPILAHW